jgi:hypothetical protein
MLIFKSCPHKYRTISCHLTTILFPYSLNKGPPLIQSSRQCYGVHPSLVLLIWKCLASHKLLKLIRWVILLSRGGSSIWGKRGAGRFTLKFMVSFDDFSNLNNFTCQFQRFLQIRGAVLLASPWIRTCWVMLLENDHSPQKPAKKYQSVHFIHVLL